MEDRKFCSPLDGFVPSKHTRPEETCNLIINQKSRDPASNLVGQNFEMDSKKGVTSKNKIKVYKESDRNVELVSLWKLYQRRDPRFS